MRFAYADPPYLGCAAKHYAKHHAAAADYDRLETHGALVDRLCAEFPDGWAMSASSPSLKRILSVCPDNVRVSPWVKPFASFKPNVNPAFAWEPVIWMGGRPRGREKPTVRDWYSGNITLQRGLTGAKDIGFCFWLFELLGMEHGDDFVDVFPGTGGVGKAWGAWGAQTSLIGGAA